MNLQKRSGQKELLDSDSIPFEDIRQNMLELDSVNSRLGGHRTTIKGFKNLLGTRKSLHVCEIGSGGGDNLLVLLAWCKAHSIAVHFTGIDINPHCIAFAKTRKLLEPVTTWLTSDYRTVVFEQPPDIIFSSLFCHHFTDAELVGQLNWMRQTAKVGFFINDLHRHSFAYHAINLLTRFFSKSYLVKNDAPLSVARGFIRIELEQLLNRASIENYAIQYRWAFRYLITYQHA